MPDERPILERIEEALAQAEHTIRRMHEAIQDMKLARNELQQARDDLRSEAHRLSARQQQTFDEQMRALRRAARRAEPDPKSS